MDSTPACLYCNEKPAVLPGYNPTFCNAYCARQWAYDYTEERFFWHPEEEAWYSRRRDGEFPAADEIGMEVE